MQTQKSQKNSKKIVKQVHKDCEKIRRERNLPPVPVTFIEHRENMGLVEVRRSLLYYAKGKYISYVDSDDVMAEGALRAFESIPHIECNMTEDFLIFFFYIILCSKICRN